MMSEQPLTPELTYGGYKLSLVKTIDKDGSTKEEWQIPMPTPEEQFLYSPDTIEPVEINSLRTVFERVFKQDEATNGVNVVIKYMPIEKDGSPVELKTRTIEGKDDPIEVVITSQTRDAHLQYGSDKLLTVSSPVSLYPRAVINMVEAEAKYYKSREAEPEIAPLMYGGRKLNFQDVVIHCTRDQETNRGALRIGHQEIRYANALSIEDRGAIYSRHIEPQQWQSLVKTLQAFKIRDVDSPS